MKQEIMEYVEKHKVGITFAEVQKYLGDNSKGGMAMFLDTNCYIWMGMSQEFTDAINDLKQEQKIALIPCPEGPMGRATSYLVDGHALSLPLASAPKAYKKPRWAPYYIELVTNKNVGAQTL